MGIAGILVIVLGPLFYAYFIEPNRLVIRKAEISIEGWDREFDGFRIASVSDIHGGSNGGAAENIRGMVHAINAQDVDIVVLLGDFVSYDREQHRANMPVSEIAGYLAELKAKMGVYAVLGNHDGWFGDDVVAKELRTAGITVLKDDIAVVEKNGKKLRIFGIRDHFQMGSWQKFDAELKKILSQNKDAGNILLLEHSPDVFPVVNSFDTFGGDYKLMLAGHTHGGQVWLPFIGSPIVPSSYGQRYRSGYITENGKHLFVTTGLGTSILPFRFLVPPEIAVLTIRSG